MATTDNNLRVPDELREQAAEIALRQGRTADDLAADALKRYIAHDKLEELSRYGWGRAKELGLAQSTSCPAIRTFTGSGNTGMHGSSR